MKTYHTARLLDARLRGRATGTITAALLLGALLSLVPAGPALAGVNRWTTTGPYGGGVTAIAVDPFHPDTVLAGFDGLGPPVFRSDDRAATWRRDSRGLDGYAPSLAFDPFTPNTAYAGTRQGVFRTADGGAHWMLASPQTVEKVVADPSTPGTLYGWTDQRVLKTVDGGANWKAASHGVPHSYHNGGYVTAVAIDPSRPQRLYAGYQAGNYVRGDRGVYRSTDGGKLWTRLPLPDVASIGDVTVDPSHPATVYVATNRGVLKSTDGGDTWKIKDAGLPERTTLSHLAVSPSDTSVVYATGEARVYRTLNGGSSWEGVGQALTPRLTAIEVDPRDASRAYVGTWEGIWSIHGAARRWEESDRGVVTAPVWSVAPAASRPQRVYAAVRNFYRGPSGVFLTTDGAKTWQDRSAGLPKLDGFPTVDRIAADPEEADTLYAATGWDGLFKTVDGGLGWKRVLHQDVVTVAVDPSAHQTVFASAYHILDSALLYKTIDGGSNWVPAATGLQTTPIQVVVDPTSPTNVFALAVNESSNGTDLYRSIDGGMTWVPITEPSPHVESLAVAPSSPPTLYAGTSDRGVFESTDGGATWSRTGDLGPHHAVTVVAIDPSRPARVYAGTYSGGVFRSEDGGQTWTPLNQGLWQPHVNDIVVSSNGTRLYAGTMTGLFEFTYR